MSYEWDPEKSAANLLKHGIKFSDASLALEDERALTMRDDSSHAEERFLSLCLDPLGRVLVVVYTWRGENIRVISARRATRRERERYEASL